MEQLFYGAFFVCLSKKTVNSLCFVFVNLLINNILMH